MITDEHLYTLTRSEFAKEIGKSREAVKQDMRRGKYKDLYIFKNNQYYFKTRETVREMKGPKLINSYPLKRKINRGNHDKAVREGRYPNFAFANHNARKRLYAIRGKLSPEELAMVPEIERRVKEERQEQIRNSLGTPGGNTRRQTGMRVGVGSYGGMMTQREMEHWDFKPTNRGHDKKREIY